MTLSWMENIGIIKKHVKFLLMFPRKAHFLLLNQ